MSSKTTKILLIISLVFNLAVLTVFAYHLLRERDFMSRADFPVPHREQIRESLDEVRADHLAYMRAKRDFFAALQAEDPDFEELEKRLETTIERQLVMEKKLGRRMIEMRRELSAEEYRNFIRNDRFSPRFKSNPGRAHRPTRPKKTLEESK
ncbi:MAG: hypothetical protein R6U84_08830 [Candidatus Cloacimonadales bacterium]